MNIDLSTLPWLPKAPENFRQQCRDAAQGNSDAAQILMALAHHSLDENQLNNLARALSKARTLAGGKIEGLHPYLLGIISNATTKLISPSIIASALRQGVDLQIVEAEYDQVMQASMGIDPTVIDANPNAILLALDYHGYAGLLRRADGDTKGSILYAETIRDNLRQHYSGTLIFQSVPCPPDALFGNLDTRQAHTQLASIQGFNQQLVENVMGSSDILLDVANLAYTIGTQNWFNIVQWNLAKLPFSQEYVPIYADHCARLIGALTGKSHKCLVLDLDNTLWGGIIGDDGMGGIVLGQGSAEGEAFLSVQQLALDLRQRGIVLAVSSKNDEPVARQVFKDHPDMLLREDHIAVFQANWNDKASNLEFIAKSLNIGVDSLVFLDDNPAERAQVRQVLPQVAVPEIGTDSSTYARIVTAAGYFEAIDYLDSDRSRADQYTANAKRADMQLQARDLTSYLASLKMEMSIHQFDQHGRKRIAQLINKSNQFNLTTKRYSEAEIEVMETNSNTLTFQVRLSDTFGDNGVISIIIVKRQDADWHIDTWLMSCRVLGRGVERTVLNELVKSVGEQGGSQLFGRYCPTSRNAMVAEHYKKLGFEFTGEDPSGETAWVLGLKEYKQLETAISVENTM